MNFLKQSMRIVLLLMVGISTVVIWIYCSAFLPTDLTRGGTSLALAQRVAGVLTVVAIVVASAIPIQSLYPRHPLVAAAAVGWMPLAVGVLAALPRTKPFSSDIEIWLLVVEGAVDWIANVMGAWVVSAGRATGPIQQPRP